jgi:type IV pilus assembly protein PilO
MFLTEQQKTTLIITLFIGGVLLVLALYFHFMIGRGMISDYQRKTEDKRTELTELRKEMRQVNQLMKQESDLQAQAQLIEKVTKRLPSSPDAPGFLNALLSILGTTSIIQQEVKPDDVNAQTLYTEIPYEIKAFGNFHAFGQFLTLMEQNPDRFMRVKELTIENNPQRPSIHPIELKIATFMFNQQGKE